MNSLGKIGTPVTVSKRERVTRGGHGDGEDRTQSRREVQAWEVSAGPAFPEEDLIPLHVVHRQKKK
jgi:hypothetical protein